MVLMMTQQKRLQQDGTQQGRTQQGRTQQDDMQWEGAQDLHCADTRSPTLAWTDSISSCVFDFLRADAADAEWRMLPAEETTNHIRDMIRVVVVSHHGTALLPCYAHCRYKNLPRVTYQTPSDNVTRSRLPRCTGCDARRMEYGVPSAHRGCTVHGLRCTIGARWVHGARCTVHCARCTVHGAWHMVCVWTVHVCTPYAQCMACSTVHSSWHVARCTVHGM
jgi:hypothetical protein